MELTSLLTSSGIGEKIDQAAQAAQAAGNAILSLPEELSRSLRQVSSYIPAQVDLTSIAMFLLYFTVGVMVLGCIGRVVLGKRSSLNGSLSSAVGILFIYVATVVVYTFKPWNLQNFLSPLPLVTFTGDYLIIFPLFSAKFPAVCAELLSLIILAFLVNLMDTLLPQGKHVITWYALRLMTVVLAMLLHLVVSWATQIFLPGVLVAYAPMILLCILIFLMLSGLVNLVVGLVIATANPFLGAMYTFFFSNLVGKQVSKAVFSSLILCGVLYLLETFHYTVLCISASALTAYIPMVIVLLALWYLIGHVL